MRKIIGWIEEVKRVCIERGYTFNKDLGKRYEKVFVSVTCNKYGNTIEIRADRFIKGAGCIQCRGDNIANNKTIKTTEEMIVNMVERHGDKFDYSKSVYNTKKKPITIICPIHSEFQQPYLLHLKSPYGCPSCAKFGFKVNKPAHLYVLSDGDLCKIGITNNEPEFRLRQINTSGNKNFKVVSALYFEKGRAALDLELNILNSSIPFGDNITYSGSTEVTDICHLPKILEYIEINKDE